MDPLLIAGLGAVFLGLAIGFLSLAFGSFARTGTAQALADIDRVYAPGAARSSRGDRAMVPLQRAFNAIGRGLTPRPLSAWTQRSLDYAGNPAGWPLERIHEMQGLGFVTLGFVGLLLGAGASLAMGVSPFVAPVVGLLFGGVIGLGVPLFVVLDMGQRRQDAIRSTLPDALDMLTLSVEAGLGFDQALVHVANGTRGPLAREFARALHEMQIGKQRAEALRAMADRTTVRELRTVAVALVQGTELGIPLAGVLREQATEMRVRRRQLAEEKARKVPVKILFPLVFCLFPALFIVVVGPGVLRIIDTLLSGR